MKKTYVLDTNILIGSPSAPFAFDEHTVVVCEVTLDELDVLKRTPGERGASAREAIRALEQLREESCITILSSETTITDGRALPGGGKFCIYSHDKLDVRDENNADGIILRSCQAMAFNALLKDSQIILVTNDINMRIRAEARGIKAEEYRTDRATLLENQYKGRCTAEAPTDYIDRFYRDRALTVDENILVNNVPYIFTPNEFVLLVDKNDRSHSAIGRFDGTAIVPLQTIGKTVYGVRPRNVAQKFAIEALLESFENAPLCILKGPAGTAKTFLSLAAGLAQVLEGERVYNKILVCRPNIKFDNDIGYLKGSEAEKIEPLIRPVYDNLEQLTRIPGEHKDGADTTNYAQDLFDRGVVTAQALAYMRGRSLSNTWLLIDEAQNMTPTQAIGIVTRCGIGTKVILCGDPEQIDDPHLDSRTNGLSYTAERMKGSPLCWQVSFDDSECVRSALALEAIHRMSPKGIKLR